MYPFRYENVHQVGNPCSKPSLDLFPRKFTQAKVIALRNMVLWSIGLIDNRISHAPHQISLCPLLAVNLGGQPHFERITHRMSLCSVHGMKSIG